MPAITVRISRASYENIYLTCPVCGRALRYNRRTDLKTFEPIGGDNVPCRNRSCGAMLRIVGDTVNAAYETLLFDCEELFRQQQYMYCVLNASQAYESFASLFLRVRLCYRPYVAGDEARLDQLREVQDALYIEAGKLAFQRLRAVVLNLIVDGVEPRSLAEAKAVVAALDQCVSMPLRRVVASYADADVARLLLLFYDSRVHEMRNAVVHQAAFRPSRAEARALIDEARRTLPALGKAMALRDDDLHSYIYEA